MWQIPKMWQGGRCFIFGGGPSVAQGFGIPKEIINDVFTGDETPEAYSDYMGFLHDKHVIGVNMAYTVGDWVDIVIFGDINFRESNKEKLLAHPALKVSVTPDKDPFFHHLRRSGKRSIGLTTNTEEVCWNLSTGAAAINLAIHLGVKEIFLLGFDMTTDGNGNQHWHKYYPQRDPKALERVFAPQIRPFLRIAEEVARLGVNIINCSPDSGIPYFRKMSIPDMITYYNRPKVLPKVSVIITAYQAPETILKCLESVIQQDYKGELEVLIGIDGCPETKAIIETLNLPDNFHVYYSEENVGTYILSNSLIDQATGEYFLRFDSDDQMYSDMLTQLVDTNASFVRCQFDWEDWITKRHIDTKGQFTCGALFGKTDIVKQIGGYKAWRCAADSDLLRRLEKMGEWVYRLPKVLYKRYRMPNSLTVTEETNMRSELRKKLHKQIVSDLENNIISIDFNTTLLCKL